MLRVVLAVAVTVALLGVAMPAVEDVRVSHADARVAGALDRVATAARTLAARNDAVPSRDAAASRRLALHFPEGTWGTAAVERLRLSRGPTNATVVRRLDAVELSPARASLLHRGGGRVPVTLRLVRRGGERRVLLSARDFTRENATSPARVRPP